MSAEGHPEFVDPTGLSKHIGIPLQCLLHQKNVMQIIFHSVYSLLAEKSLAELTAPQQGKEQLIYGFSSKLEGEQQK